MRTRLFSRTLFVVALAALTMGTVAVSTAGGAAATNRPAASYYTPAALHAMGARYQAMADWYRNRPAATHYTPAALNALGGRYQAMADWYRSRPAATHYTPAALKAMGERWQALANSYATRTAQPTPFQWNDALLGAGAAVGVIAVLGAAALVMRGHEHHAHLGRHTFAH